MQLPNPWTDTPVALLTSGDAAQNSGGNGRQRKTSSTILAHIAADALPVSASSSSSSSATAIPWISIKDERKAMHELRTAIAAGHYPDVNHVLKCNGKTVQEFCLASIMGGRTKRRASKAKRAQNSSSSGNGSSSSAEG